MPKIKDMPVPLHDRWKEKISQSNVLTRLIKHFNGELDPPLDQTQVQIGLAFVRKVLPDLKSVDISGRIEHQHMSRLELEHRLIALGRDPKQVWQELETRHQTEAKSLKVGDNSGAIDPQSIAQQPQLPEIIEETEAEE